MIAVNDLLLLKIVALNQCGVVWNKIIVEAAMLLVVKKRIV